MNEQTRIELKTLLGAFEDAAFECGEWDSRYSDTLYEDVDEACVRAREAIVRFFEEHC